MSPARPPPWDLIRAGTSATTSATSPPCASSGVSVAVAAAVPEVRRAATNVTRARPGHGAIRELCDVILAAHHRL
jgi:3-deoxy-D-manno-octulosonate 8-phosphate phosphatase KdsC-like HAD superfamily phosphatase